MPKMVMALSDIKVIVNGKEIYMDVKPFVVNGRTLVPIRFVAENLNATVDYDAPTKCVTITKADKEIKIFVGQKKTIVNGVVGQLDEPPVTKNGRTFVPLRFVAENLDCIVDWNSSTRTVTITSKGNVNPEPKEEPVNPQDKQALINKYLELSKKAKTLDDFKAYPVTDYCPLDQVPGGWGGVKWIETIRYAEMSDLPITVIDKDVYDISIGKLDNGINVLTITARVPDRVTTLPLIYATKEEGLMVTRDTHIGEGTETLAQIGDKDFIVIQKYHLPTRQGYDLSDVEYFVFYSPADKDSIAIKNPYYKK